MLNIELSVLYATNVAKGTKMKAEQEWRPAPEQLELQDGVVHIWRVDLMRSFADFEQLRTLLSAPEQTRLAKFHFSRDQQRFGIARASLRKILASYFAADPKSLEIATTQFGKPYLSQPEYASLSFNVSHSGDLALVGVTLNRAIGVDLEEISRTIQPMQIATQFFSAQEQAALLKYRGDAQRQAFFRCWTRKEAYSKATGRGLQISLNQFSVSIDAEPEVTLEHHEPQEQQWTVYGIEPQRGYVGALAVEGALQSIHYWIDAL
jgi:4'-phosphopantetheinyl transferase